MQNQTLQAYLTALGAKTSTPGGGAVAAITGGQLAALIKMVAEFTNSDDDHLALERNAIILRADEATKEFLNLARADAEGFNEVMAAYKLPKRSEQEKQERSAAIQAALIVAVDAPLKTLMLAASLASDISFLSTHGNKNLVTDTGIAALLINTTIRAAEMNVRINLQGIKALDFVAKTEQQIARVMPTCKQMIELANQINSSLKRQ